MAKDKKTPRGLRNKNPANVVNDSPPKELGDLQDFRDERAAIIMELLREKLAGVMGVTLQGTRLTVRFGAPLDHYVVSMVVVSVTDYSVREDEDLEDK